MRHRFDHLGKTIGHAALSLSGATQVEVVIAPDARRADLCHEPDPSKNAERERLGLLGRIASFVGLIELYSSAPSDDDTMACLGKLVAFWQQRRRNADKASKEKALEGDRGSLTDPMCWIIAARRPAAAIARFDAKEATDWPKGVYFGTGTLFAQGGALCVGIVDASELPRDRSTLLVRFMAAGPLLTGAIKELEALEKESHERMVAEQILVDLEHVLTTKPSPTPEEEEFAMTMRRTWSDARDEGLTEGRVEGRTEGRAEGRAEANARAVLTVLRIRGLAVSNAERERISSEKDPARLELWHERAILAASVAEVLGDESQAA